MTDQNNDTVAVGQCENCGYVTGDSVDYRFPQPAECNDCGEQLLTTTIADAEEVSRFA